MVKVIGIDTKIKKEEAMVNFLDYEELEEEILKELEEYKDCIVELPKTQEELKRRFSLKNDEVSIDEVEFGEINLDDISAFMVKLPKTQEEFNKRFLYD